MIRLKGGINLPNTPFVYATATYYIRVGIQEFITCNTFMLSIFKTISISTTLS
jgi:hypothetical protein